MAEFRAGIGAQVGRAGVLVAVVLVAGAGLAGCTSGKKSASASVTVTASTTPSGTGTGTAAVSTSAAASKTAARATPVKPAPTLPRCDTVLPATAVDKAVARRLSGSAFVVNQPDPTIAQLARINCQYGLGAPPATARATRTPAATASAGEPIPQVEVSVSLYANKAAAAARITATASQWRSQGATAHRVIVGTHPATVLTGYGRPLLVLASGVRTVAVSVRSGTVSANRVDAALTQIARSALAGSGG